MDVFMVKYTYRSFDGDCGASGFFSAGWPAGAGPGGVVGVAGVGDAGGVAGCFAGSSVLAGGVAGWPGGVLCACAAPAAKIPHTNPIDIEARVNMENSFSGPFARPGPKE